MPVGGKARTSSLVMVVLWFMMRQALACTHLQHRVICVLQQRRKAFRLSNCSQCLASLVSHPAPHAPQAAAWSVPAVVCLHGCAELHQLLVPVALLATDMGCSLASLSTAVSTPIAAASCRWPRQKQTSCRNSAEESLSAAAQRNTRSTMVQACCCALQAVSDHTLASACKPATDAPELRQDPPSSSAS